MRFIPTDSEDERDRLKRSSDWARRAGYGMLAASVLASLALGGCIAMAAAAGAGAGYAVGHEQGEDHVTEGVHGDDD